ncbi:MAG: hypothetical protein PHC34_04225 [Candidatus Gastranaerophilales bacterium]|nr:hypothetical protein [Candidatus Gastranaerophilales bacterium]
MELNVESLINKLKRLPVWIYGALILIFLTTIFCSIYYSNHFIIQSDVYNQLYWHNHPNLLNSDWHSIQGYLGWQPIIGKYFPFNILMHFIINLCGNNPLITLKLLQINSAISLFLLSFFTYILFRFWGRSFTASIAGAIIIAFTGFDHIHAGIKIINSFYLHSFMFIPIVLLFLTKANRENSIRWALVAGIMIGLSLLSGINMPLFLIAPMFFFVYTVDCSFKEIFNLQKFIKSSFYALIALIIGIIIAAVLILPSLGYSDLNNRQSFVDISNLTGYINPIKTILIILYKNWWYSYNPHFLNAQNIFDDFDCFIGFPCLILSLLGLFTSGKSIAGKWFMIITALFSLIIMHMNYMPDFIYVPLHTYLSKFSLRLPFRASWILLFAIAFFVACGLDNLKTFYNQPNKNKTLILIGINTFIYILIGSILLYKITPLVFYTVFLTCLILTGIFYFVIILYSKKYKIGYNILIIYILFTIQVISNYPNIFLPITISDITKFNVYNVKQNIHELFDDNLNKWKPILEKEKEPYRIINFKNTSLKTNIWTLNTSAEIAFEPLPINEPTTLKYFVNYFKAAIPIEKSSFIDLFNIKYLYLINPDKKLIKTKIKNIYRNPYVFDRYFITHGALFFDDQNYLKLGLQFSTSKDLRKNVFLERKNLSQQNVSYKHNGYEKVKIIKRKSDYIELSVDMKSPGYLVASEIWFPAWNVSVDNKKVKLLRAYSALQAVYLDKGKHKIVFYFWDWYSFWGKIITALSLILLIYICFFRKWDNNFRNRKK